MTNRPIPQLQSVTHGDNPTAVAEPGTKNWSSALSRVPHIYREAMLEHAKKIAKQESTAPSGFQRGPLEVEMLSRGRALSMITYAAFLPFHLVGLDEQEAIQKLLANHGPKAVYDELKPRLDTAQAVLLIGDDPSVSAIEKAMKAMAQAQPVASIVVGPGNLMEGFVRQWSASQDPIWPAHAIHTMDGSAGEVWQAPASDRLDRLVTQLFDAHRPDRVALLEPVRLPATQACIEQAAHRRIPMISFEAQRIGFKL